MDEAPAFITQWRVAQRGSQVSVGTVAHIFIAPSRGAPMQSVVRAEAVTESGLIGAKLGAPRGRQRV